MFLRGVFTKNSLKTLIPSTKYSNAAQSQFGDEDRETSFGFQTVKESEKTKKVYDVFEKVATQYDTMNDAMSLGIHRIWKDIFMCRLSPMNNTSLIDVAGGTGDVSFRFLNYIKNNNLKGCHVTVTDINENMLEVGKKRSKSLEHDPSLISFQQADGENLPFGNDSFNAYTISFGIRNCTRIDKVLKEAYRVLQPGGRFLCLEFSLVENELLRRIYDVYSFDVIPIIGQVIAGQWEAYKYLVESIRKFPDQQTFKTMIEEAGFRQVTYENITFGMVAIHSGFKI